MSAPAPRVYVYRKSGRTVWDVEIWLPDGTRKTWRSGLEDREAALTAGIQRAQAMLALPRISPPDSSAGGGEVQTTREPTVQEQVIDSAPPPEMTAPETAVPVHQGRQSSKMKTPQALVERTEGSSLHSLLDRLDRWFWSQLGLR